MGNYTLNDIQEYLVQQHSSEDPCGIISRATVLWLKAQDLRDHLWYNNHVDVSDVIGWDKFDQSWNHQRV